MYKLLKLFSELIPLIIFFVCYKYKGIQNAAIYMFIASVIVIAVLYIIEKKIHVFSIVSTAILLISAIMSIATGNAMFIKMKPTVLYISFGCAFLLSVVRKKPFLAYMLKDVIELSEYSWNILSYRFAFFFFFMAILNEVVWRNVSEGIWVKFKVFGAIPLTIFFTLIQIPFLLRNKMNTEDIVKNDLGGQ